MTNKNKWQLLVISVLLAVFMVLSAVLSPPPPPPPMPPMHLVTVTIDDHTMIVPVLGTNVSITVSK